jgi:hypothetical protein
VRTSNFAQIKIFRISVKIIFFKILPVSRVTALHFHKRPRLPLCILRCDASKVEYSTDSGVSAAMCQCLSVKNAGLFPIPLHWDQAHPTRGLPCCLLRLPATIVNYIHYRILELTVIFIRVSRGPLQNNGYGPFPEKRGQPWFRLNSILQPSICNLLRSLRFRRSNRPHTSLSSSSNVINLWNTRLLVKCWLLNKTQQKNCKQMDA